MTWVKLDDGFAEHPKIEALTSGAFRLHVTALCHCARKLTDGHLTVTDTHVCRLIAKAKPAHALELVAAGLWRDNPQTGGFSINDYLDYNPPAEQVKAEREAARERMRQLRNGKKAA